MTGENPSADHQPGPERDHAQAGSAMSDIDAKQHRYDRFANQAELPMLVLSMLMVPVVLMPFLEDLSPESLYTLEVLGAFLWAAFAVQYAMLVYLSPDRWRTISENKLDLLIVLLPFLRPLRLLRVVQLAHAGTALARSGKSLRKLIGRPEFGGTIATIGGFVIVSGVLVTIAEHDQPNSTITNIGDGIWWAIVTCTTVGYGDEFPATATGRLVAVLLMLAGIGGLSVITADVAAYFVSNDSEDEHEELSDRLERIERKLELVAAHLDTGPPADADPPTDHRVGALPAASSSPPPARRHDDVTPTAATAPPPSAHQAGDR